VGGVSGPYAYDARRVQTMLDQFYRQHPDQRPAAPPAAPDFTAEAVPYLRSLGLKDREARRLLAGVTGETLEEVVTAAVRRL
jgi:hypothetical protein